MSVDEEIQKMVDLGNIEGVVERMVEYSSGVDQTSSDAEQAAAYKKGKPKRAYRCRNKYVVDPENPLRMKPVGKPYNRGSDE